MITRLAVAGVLSSLATFPAHALNTRTWISGHGTDQASCGAVTSPCRTLQYAHDNTAAGGEIDVLDPAGYGSLVITKSINIINEGVGVAGILASPGGNGVTINAGANDVVVLRGLAIEGARVGANGVVFNSGGQLTISNCLVQNFAGNNSTAGNGILVQHASGKPEILIKDTTTSNNGYVGLFHSSVVGARLSVDRVTASHNAYGVVVGMSAVVAITNSYASNNSATGVQVYRQGPGPFVDDVLLESVQSINNHINVEGVGGPTMRMSRVTTRGPYYDLYCDVTCTIQSYRDNVFRENWGNFTSVTVSHF